LTNPVFITSKVTYLPHTCTYRKVREMLNYLNVSNSRTLCFYWCLACDTVVNLEMYKIWM